MIGMLRCFATATTSSNEGGPESERWLALYRRPITLVCNLAEQRLRLALKYPCRPILSSDPAFALHENVLELAGESVVILEEHSP